MTIVNLTDKRPLTKLYGRKGLMQLTPKVWDKGFVMVVVVIL